MLVRKLAISALIMSVGTAHADSFMKLEGRKSPQRQMEIKSSGVPSYPLYTRETVKRDGKSEDVFNKISEIPRLNVGFEGRLVFDYSEMTDFPERPRSLKQNLTVRRGNVPEIKVPVITVGIAEPVNKANRSIASAKPAAKPLPKLEEHNPKVNQTLLTSEVSTQSLENFTPSRLKLLQGLIFLQEVEEYPLALGLFAELLEDKEVGHQAKYYLGLTAKKVGLEAEFRRRMLAIVQEKDSPMRKLALEQLLSNIPDNDFQLATRLLPHIRPILGTEVDNPRFLLVEAKMNLQSGNLERASDLLSKIKDGTEQEHHRKYLQGIIAYRTGQGDKAREYLLTLLNDLKDKEDKESLKTLASLTLARLYFQIGEYQKAYNSYLSVDKQHPLWLDSLIEQAWSQVLAGDNEGAAGNMFSLHTELFKGVFKPESHIARTVAYVNLCQYGDALHVLKDFKQTYSPTHKSLVEFRKANRNKDAYYELVREFLTIEGSPGSLKGLPASFILEFARHPQFVGLQGEINELANEETILNSVYGQLIETERKAVKETSEIQQKTHELRTALIEEKNENRKKSLQARIDKHEREVLSYEIKRYIANKSRTAIKDFRQEGLKVLADEREYYRSRAAQFLEGRFMQLAGELNYYLEQGDLLQYEIFSGAGEHLRFQLSGGEVPDSKGKPVQVAKEDAQNWKYKGELWTDEVGFFRSSLKNVCPPDEVARNNR